MEQRGKLTENGLLKAIIWSYKNKYLYIMFLNSILAILRLSSIFLIKPLVEFIKDGENRWEMYGINFIDTSSSGLFSLLTPQI